MTPAPPPSPRAPPPRYSSWARSFEVADVQAGVVEHPWRRPNPPQLVTPLRFALQAALAIAANMPPHSCALGEQPSSCSSWATRQVGAVEHPSARDQPSLLVADHLPQLLGDVASEPPSTSSGPSW